MLATGFTVSGSFDLLFHFFWSWHICVDVHLLELCRCLHENITYYTNSFILSKLILWRLLLRRLIFLWVSLIFSGSSLWYAIHILKNNIFWQFRRSFRQLPFLFASSLNFPSFFCFSGATLQFSLRSTFSFIFVERCFGGWSGYSWGACSKPIEQEGGLSSVTHLS